MCKTTIMKQRSLMGVVSTAALLGLLAAGTINTAQAQSCNNLIGAGITVNGPYGNQYIHIGQVATISQVAIFVPGGVNACSVTNLKAWVVYPNNSYQQWLDMSTSHAVLAGGALGSTVTCPGNTNCLAFSSTYTIQAPDVGGSLSFTTNWPSGFTFSLANTGTGNQVQFATAGAGSTISSTPGAAQPALTQPLIVLQPCINVTKNCLTNCTTYGDPIGFSGTIANCSVLQSNASDGTLFITSVSDNPSTPITIATLTSKGRTYDGTLQQGESVTYTGSYSPTVGCGPFSDTITVIAADVTGFLLTNSASATCHVKTTPAILISKDCHVLGGTNKTLQLGDLYVDDFTVQNTGNVPLQNAVIHDIDPLSGVVNLSLGSLAIGQTVTVHYTNGPVTAANCGPNPDSATVTADSICPADATCPSALHVTNGPATCSLFVVCVPKICVTKGILCGPQGANPVCSPNQTYLKVDTGVNGVSFCYRVIVSNCGPITLTNVTVIDTQLGTLVNFPTTLTPGQSATNTYSKSYPGSPSGATTNVNVVTATGTGNGITTNAVDSATAIVVPIGVQCKITLNSALDLDGSANDNHVTLPYGTTLPVGFNLTVTNTGKADLSVSLVGVPPLFNCSNQNPIVVPGATNIPAGGSVTIAGCMLPGCPGMTNLITVQGTAIASLAVPCIYDSQGNALTTAASQCTSVVVCQPPLPKVCVTKGIICGPQGTPNPVCNPNQTYLKVDTGVNGAAFCYRIIVSNCGDATLTNLTVVDTQLGTLDFSSYVPLLPGQSATNTYSKSYGNPSSATGTTNVNVVTVTGTGNGITTNATDTATAITVPIGVRCSILLFSSEDLDNNPTDNHVTLPAGTTNAPVQFCLTVTNTGKADLLVSLTNVPPLVDCDNDSTPVPVPPAVTIVAGGSYEICGCVLIGCPGLDMQVTVKGTAVASLTVPCVYDSQGNAVTTSASSCPATVNCETAVSCRVTGGGTLYAGDVSTNCINVVTVLYDRLADQAGLVVDHISHGGQLGAPFSQMDCADRLANPCIRGEWQHVRHYDNKVNGQQDVFDMSFHSANPNITGHFDTLNCACLPCCSSNIVLKPAPPGWDHFRFQVCNKDDRKICGPLPRPAPANAIIFTGIGTFTPNTSTGNGKNAQRRYVVFRVYIEDRSEPGGIHPKGGNMPGTVYCFQAWDTGISTAKKMQFDDLAKDFRIALGEDSCAFLAALSNGNLPQGSLPPTTVDNVPADTVDQGPLRNGSQQIHPSTSATCTQ